MSKAFRLTSDYRTQARLVLKDDGRRLRDILKSGGWTCRSIARALATTHGTIWRFAHGKPVRADTAVALGLWLDDQSDWEST